ncbi:MAG: amino acid permease [Candidatus Nomurabacteria bacterium]|nr:MAG: amino acid permease [Candidatus Nomurabacteria bacterium]
MKLPSTTFSQLSILLGAILGVGMFGLPYLTARAGWTSLLLWFLVAGFVLLIVGFCYIRILHNSQGQHRLPGYVEQHLGHRWKQAAIFTTTMSIWGALLVYAILGGQFLHDLFADSVGGSSLFYLLVFYVSAAALLYVQAKTIARVEILLLCFFLVLLAMLFITGSRTVQFDFSSWDIRYFILPYGAVLFSLWGIDVVPDAAELGERSEKHMRKTYFIALASAVLIYCLFVYAILSMSGMASSRDALSGLVGLLPQKVLLFGYIIGFIATFTSFISLGMNLHKTFQFDYGQSKHLALFSTLAFPLAVALAGVSDYLNVMGIVGSLAVGAEAIIILHMYDRFSHGRAHLYRQRDWLTFLTRPLMLLLGFGVILGILTPFLLKYYG